MGYKEQMSQDRRAGIFPSMAEAPSAATYGVGPALIGGRQYWSDGSTFWPDDAHETIRIAQGEDGTSVLQAAIDAASAASRGWQTTVKVVGTDFYLSAPIIPKSNVTLVGGTGRSKTRVRANNISFFEFPDADVSQFHISGFYFTSIDGGTTASTAGWLFDINPASVRLQSQIKIQNCVSHRLFGGIRFGANSRPIVFDVEDCEFWFGGHYYVSFEDGCQTNLINFWKVRFEQNSPTAASQIKSIGNASAILGVNFTACVFEANYGQYAVSLGNNPSFGFYNCHFEANNQGALANGADIYWANGAGSVCIQHCIFSSPYSTNTSWYNIRGGDSGVCVVSIGNRVLCNAAGYTGYARVLYGASFTSVADNFYQCPVTLDPFVGVVTPNVIGSHDGRSKSQSLGPSTHRLQTTGATATAIWQFDYHASGMTKGLYHLRAIVCCTDSTGNIQGRWEINQSITAAATPTALGADTGAAAQKSAGAASCAVALSFSSDNSGQIKLNVTGIAATTINWTARIELTLAAI